MPTAAWTGFLHSWHTLGIVLKWMCITVIGIPFAIATCLVVALAALAFGALCLCAVGLAGAIVFYILKGIWWFLTRIPSWIDEWRIRRAERLLLGGLPMTEDRSRMQQWFGRGDQPQAPIQPVPMGYRNSITLTAPPRAHLLPVVDEDHPTPIQGLPGMIECQVCMEEKWPIDFPDRAPTDNCEHDATDCCKRCLETTLASAFEGNMWDDIRCPSCNLQLVHKDVAEFATPDIFDRYDTLSTRRALEREVPNFRWCLGPSCTFGQEHPDNPSEQPIVACSSCGFVQCSHHQTKWHEGLTCAEYDVRIAAGASAADKHTEKIIKRIAKRCPGCRRYINKNGGCPHMTCLCGRQWCWNCMHDYPGHTWGCIRRH